MTRQVRAARQNAQAHPSTAGRRESQGWSDGCLRSVRDSWGQARARRARVMPPSRGRSQRIRRADP